MNPSPGPSNTAPNGSPSPRLQQQETSGRPKGEDYVYFDRSTSEFTSDAVSRATAAKLKLESYYKVAVDAAIERNGRYAFPWLLSLGQHGPNECCADGRSSNANW
jgi:protein-serine/threonine kinase